MRIIVVDDDAFVVRSLATILSAETDVDVVGTGTTGDQAVELYRALSPDVALLDIQMPGRDGLSAAEEILRGDPGARVVFLTTFSDDDYIVRALRLGARGYLIKQDVATIAPRCGRSWRDRASWRERCWHRHAALVPWRHGRRRAGRGGARRPHAARARGGARHRRWDDQYRGGRRPVHERGNGPQPHLVDPGQAGTAQPHADRRVLLPPLHIRTRRGTIRRSVGQWRAPGPHTPPHRGCSAGVRERAGESAPAPPIRLRAARSRRRRQ